LAEALPDLADVLPDWAGVLPDMADVLPDWAGVLPDMADVLPDWAGVFPGLDGLAGVATAGMSPIPGSRSSSPPFVTP
jgi:DNA-directed RNA polymerase II subunit RPB1